MKATQPGTSWPAVIGIALVAAALGFMYFGMRGITLWVPVAVVLTIALHWLPRRFQRGALVLALLVAAVAFGHASTLGWSDAAGPDGTRYKVSPIGLADVSASRQPVSPVTTCRWYLADAPDGTRYKASPLGLVQVLQPRQPVSPVSACRWYYADARVPRCAMVPGADVARRQLLAVFPLVCLAIAACLLGVLVQLRGKARPGEMDRGSGLLAAGAAIVSLLLFSGSVDVALQDLASLHVGIGGSLGMMEMTLAILLCLAVCTAPAKA